MALVTMDAVRAASARLEGVIEPTPVEPSRALSSMVGAEVLLKCENLQRTGSFKLRGAYNRIAQLTDDQKSRGVVCASAGNHAQGVALGARLQGVEATVFMPREAPLPKVDATLGYGATIDMDSDNFDAALASAQIFAEETGRVFVHPFDHEDIIAGQATVGVELNDQIAGMDTVIVPVGGGGLISGIAVALRDANPNIRIVGVQAAAAASMPASLEAGTPVLLPSAMTIADGIAVKRPGELTLRHCEALVDAVVTVDDAQLAQALVLLLERAKLVVEPAGAAAVAALVAGRVEPTGRTVAVLSGGNIDPLVLNHLVQAGLTSEGRYVTLRTRVPDKPGELVRMLRLLADQRANVLGIEHHRLGRRLQLGQVEVVVELEVRGEDHISRLMARLQKAGYPVRRN